MSMVIFMLLYAHNYSNIGMLYLKYITSDCLKCVWQTVPKSRCFTLNLTTHKDEISTKLMTTIVAILIL